MRPSPRPVRSFEIGTRAAVWSLAFSPDGRLLASGDNGHAVRLWDVPAGCGCGELATAHKYRVRELAFSPDGLTVASCSAGQRAYAMARGAAVLWDVRTRRHVPVPDGGRVGFTFRSPTFTPDSAAVAFRHDTVRVFDARTGRPVGELPEGRRGDVVAFAPGGRELVFGEAEGTLRVWDVAGRSEARSLAGCGGRVTRVAFSAGGELLAAADDVGGVIVFDYPAGVVRQTFAGGRGAACCLAALPGGIGLVSAHGPDASTTVVRWAVGSADHVAEWTPPSPAEVRAVAVSADGGLVATGDQVGAIRVWRLVDVLPDPAAGPAATPPTPDVTPDRPAGTSPGPSEPAPPPPTADEEYEKYFGG